MLTSGKKNCAEMSRSVGISEKALYRFLSNGSHNSDEIEKLLIKYAASTRKKDHKRTLVIDPTALIKRYAECMENLCYDKDGCTKHVEKVIVPVCASIADDRVKIPLGLNFWVQRKARGKRKYRSKVELTQELIKHFKSKKVDYDYVSLDGAFPTPDMFMFLQQSKEIFILRIPRSRCVITKNGKRLQLQHIKELKLLRNEREKTVEAELYGKIYFFTAYKRKLRAGGWETIFLVSNMNLTAKAQVAAYNRRWPQEKINRTSKQKFGMHQCQALAAEKQKAHIMAGYLAQAIIEFANIDKLAQSVDEVINIFRANHFNDLVKVTRKPPKIKRRQKVEYIEVSSQKHVQNFYNNARKSNAFMM